MTDDLRYPIGKFIAPATYSPEWRRQAIDIIAETPTRLRDAVKGLDEAQLAAPYRPEGWTLRQVVHHVADSHINAYVRIRLTLTESVPTLRPYDESMWARLPDVDVVPVEVSLDLLDMLHARWVALLRAMREGDFDRLYDHPDTGRHSLNYLVAMYAWHGTHHTAHITGLRHRMGW